MESKPGKNRVRRLKKKEKKETATQLIWNLWGSTKTYRNESRRSQISRISEFQGLNVLLVSRENSHFFALCLSSYGAHLTWFDSNSLFPSWFFLGMVVFHELYQKVNDCSCLKEAKGKQKRSFCCFWWSGACLLLVGFWFGGYFV